MYNHGVENFSFVPDRLTNSETEKEVMESIKNLKGDKTIIMIAHRISTLVDCDEIYKIQDKGILIN